MSKTLKEKTAHGIFWSFLDKFGQQGLHMVVGIILMRYFLSPAEYGLVAVIIICNALGYVIIDSGFSNALIRKKEVTQTDLSSVFYFNVILSLLIYLLIFLAAPFIAFFYENPLLIKLVRIMALSIPLYSLSLVQITLFTKAIDFKRLAFSNIIALVCSGTLSLLLAWKGYGVWVLVMQPLSVIFVKNICLWSLSSWRPTLVYSKNSIKDLWKYSSKLLASSTLSVICKNLYASLIGKYYPIEQAGFYSNANKYAEISFQTVIPAISTTVYPAMSNLQDEPEQLKKAFRKTVRVSSFVFFPVMLGLIVAAEPLILTVFGTKWLSIVPYFKVLCAGYLFMGMSSLNNILLFLKGKSAAFLYFTLSYNIALLISIVISVHIGVLAMAISWSIVSVVYTAVYTLYTSKMIAYRLGEFVKDIIPYFTLALVMSAGVSVLSYFIQNHIILVGVQVVSGAAFYLGATYLLGSKVFKEVVEIIKNKTIK